MQWQQFPFWARAQLSCKPFLPLFQTCQSKPSPRLQNATSPRLLSTHLPQCCQQAAASRQKAPPWYQAQGTALPCVFLHAQWSSIFSQSARLCPAAPPKWLPCRPSQAARSCLSRQGAVQGAQGKSASRTDKAARLFFRAEKQCKAQCQDRKSVV